MTCDELRWWMLGVAIVALALILGVLALGELAWRHRELRRLEERDRRMRVQR